MDIAFVSGMAAFVSAMLIFVGSAFLLLMLIVGARLAYFITASITLAFMLIMGVVWSINPLGPVGQLPEWEPLGTAESAEQIEEPAAIAEYPEGGWRAPNEDDAHELTQASELESAATEHVETQAAEGKIDLPQILDEVVLEEDSSRLYEQDGTLYGATTVEVTVEGETSQWVAAFEYDPGNPLGRARAITLGTLVLLVLHLFGLSRAERRAKETTTA